MEIVALGTVVNEYRRTQNGDQSQAKPSRAKQSQAEPSRAKLSRKETIKENKEAKPVFPTETIFNI